MLDNRLSAVASFVPQGCKVADIGTDHGYLAMALYQSDNQRLVIAADKNLGPCEAAKKTLQASNLSQYIEVRQGDGLAAVAPGEIDTVCIAGMGGSLIGQILAAQPLVFAQLQQAILQPQNAGDSLREWLYQQGWHVAGEKLAKEDGRIYQIILAQPGQEPMPSQVELLVGPKILQERPELFAEHLHNIISSYERVVAGLQKSSKDTSEQQQGYQKIIQSLEALL